MRARATCFNARIQAASTARQTGQMDERDTLAAKGTENRGVKGWGDNQAPTHTPQSPNKVPHAHRNQSGRQLKTISTSNG